MIYIVSGFMRSGTSMMCACLEAGGMDILKSTIRDCFGEAHSDEKYKVNPQGLYEPDPSELNQPGWPRQHDGKTIKVVVPWLGYLSVFDYKIVFMRRNAEEIRQSYEAAFGGNIGGNGKPEQRIANIERRINESLEQLHNRKDVKSIVELEYRNVIYNPLTAFEALANDGWPIDVSNAVSVVNTDLCRFKLENLTIGI